MKTALLQLSLFPPGIVYLFHLTHLPSLPPLIVLLLQSPHIIKVGINIANDVYKLVGEHYSLLKDGVHGFLEVSSSSSNGGSGGGGVEEGEAVVMKPLAYPGLLP